MIIMKIMIILIIIVIIIIKSWWFAGSNSWQLPGWFHIGEQMQTFSMANHYNHYTYKIHFLGQPPKFNPRGQAKRKKQVAQRLTVVPMGKAEETNDASEGDFAVKTDSKNNTHRKRTTDKVHQNGLCFFFSLFFCLYLLMHSVWVDCNRTRSWTLGMLK